MHHGIETFVIIVTVCTYACIHVHELACKASKELNVMHSGYWACSTHIRIYPCFAFLFIVTWLAYSRRSTHACCDVCGLRMRRKDAGVYLIKSSCKSVAR